MTSSRLPSLMKPSKNTTKPSSSTEIPFSSVTGGYCLLFLYFRSFPVILTQFYLISYFRAAAYCRLEQHDLAIQDCRTALALEPTYAKAYGRMGVALSCQNRYDDAVTAYQKALELDPNNESYKQNLQIAEEKQAEAQAAGAGAGGAGGKYQFSIFAI